MKKKKKKVRCSTAKAADVKVKKKVLSLLSLFLFSSLEVLINRHICTAVCVCAGCAVLYAGWGACCWALLEKMAICCCLSLVLCPPPLLLWLLFLLLLLLRQTHWAIHLFSICVPLWETMVVPRFVFTQSLFCTSSFFLALLFCFSKNSHTVVFCCERAALKHWEAPFYS